MAVKVTSSVYTVQFANGRLGAHLLSPSTGRRHAVTEYELATTNFETRLHWTQPERVWNKHAGKTFDIFMCSMFLEGGL